MNNHTKAELGIGGGHEGSVREQSLPVDPATVKILSGTDGELAVNAEQKKVICYVSDTRLFVAEGKQMDVHVQSYIANLNRRQKKYKVVYVQMATIARIYSMCGGGAVRADASMMQDQCMQMIRTAADRRASDVHIRVGAFTQLFFRIHGDLVKIAEEDKDYGLRLARTFYQAIADMSEDTFKENERLDGRISSADKLPENVYGVRISSTPTDNGILMVLRLLYNDADDSSDIRNLGFSQLQYDLTRLLNEQPTGMNIICGPTGSGKSTTLQRVLRWQLEESNYQRHVITVEDPPEYPIHGAVQTPVGGGTNEENRRSNFTEAIVSAMRLDPDTIMVGEMRDKSSAQMALRASMTGHQVWSTLHANSAMAIIDRLVDLELSIDLLTDHTIITGLISQRLVKVLCPHCKKALREHPDIEAKIPHGLLDRLKRTLGAEFVNVCMPGDGCSTCRNTGFAGRTVVAEVIIPDPKFMEFIKKGDKIGARDHWLKQQRGTTILAHALAKIKNGEIDPINAERIVGRLNMDGLLEDSHLTMSELAGGGLVCNS